MRLSTFAFLICCFSTQAQQVITPNNAVALSLGGTSTTYSNVFSIENNVAALSYCSNTIAVNGSNRFGLSEYSNLFLVGCYSLENSSIGVSYKISPLAQFTEQKVQLAFAKKLMENISVGISLNYHQFSSPNAFYRNTNVLTFNAGVLYDINENLQLGFLTFNPNQTLLTEFPNEPLPSEYRLGLKYKLDENIDLYCDAVQLSNSSLSASAGIELKKENYYVRGGFGLNSTFGLGFGYKRQKAQLDLAASYHNQLGFSPSLNLSYAL